MREWVLARFLKGTSTPALESLQVPGGLAALRVATGSLAPRQGHEASRASAPLQWLYLLVWRQAFHKISKWGKALLGSDGEKETERQIYMCIYIYITYPYIYIYIRAPCFIPTYV